MTYEIKTNILTLVQEKNFGHPIFTCLNPKGEIKPGSTARVLWIFSPIEAKTYKVSSSLGPQETRWGLAWLGLALTIPSNIPTFQVNVPIHILGWKSALICFYGVGYDPHIMGDTALFHNITSWDNSCVYSRMMVPGQVRRTMV